LLQVVDSVGTAHSFTVSVGIFRKQNYAADSFVSIGRALSPLLRHATMMRQRELIPCK
jgi:hypothetical protein